MDQDKEFLGKAPVGRLLAKLAIPAVVAQLVNLLYNMVDRIYIGRYDATGLALTGVGVCLPVIMMISAFACLVGMGGAPQASIFMGKREYEKAEKTMGNCFSLLLILSAALTVGLSLFAQPILLTFGASQSTIGPAMEYMNLYVLGTVFVQISLGMNAFISAQGFTTVSMLSVLIGAVLNIILDPIFIFVLHMGVRGAALATVLSQAVSALWILRFLLGKKTVLRIQKKHLRIQWSYIGPCLALGVSPFIMQITESALNVCFNTSLLKYGGDIAVGAMTVLATVMQFCMLPLQGLSQGAQPITSYNYGARQPERVKKSFQLLLLSSAAYTVALWGCVMLFPEFFVRLFNQGNAALIDYACWAARIYFAVMCLMGVQLACQQTLISIGNAKTSLFLAVLRKIILLIPLIYILPAIFQRQDMAVFLAEPIADFIAITTTVALFRVEFRKAMASISGPPAAVPEAGRQAQE